MKNAMQFVVDKDNNKINVERGFAAPVAKVWAAWTKPEILDQWWAPRPWKAETKSMDFTAGGAWLYAMVGPQGEKHWSRADYKEVEEARHFSAMSAFCDEDGKINEAMSGSLWNVDFSDDKGDTKVNINITYKDKDTLEKMIEMGFKEGFTMGLGNLDKLLAKQ